MAISYNNLKLIPAPMVNIQKNYHTTGDGTKIGATFTITLNGKIVAWKGSPRSGMSDPPLISTVGFGGPFTAFWEISNYPPDELIKAESRLPAILRKQEAIRELFSIDGEVFDILPDDGSPSIFFNPRVVDIQFPDEGGPEVVNWFDTCPYTITLEADILHLNGASGDEDNFNVNSVPVFIKEANEDWAVEFGDFPGTFRLTHNVSATAKKHFNDTEIANVAWENAKLWVLDRLGLNSSILASGAFGVTLNSLGGFNHVRSETIGQSNGQYSVTETWLLSSGNAVEDFNVTTRFASQGQAETVVTIEGNVTGLSSNNNLINQSDEKFTNATNKFNEIQPLLLSRAQSFSGLSVGALPKTKVIGRNPFTGIINYTFEFDGSNTCKLLSNSLSETITVSDTNPHDLFGNIPVIGRLKGPILQDIGSKSERRRDISMEIVIEASSDCTDIASNLNRKPDVEFIVDALTPSPTAKLFKAGDQESWSWMTGRYSRNVSFVWESP